MVGNRHSPFSIGYYSLVLIIIGMTVITRPIYLGMNSKSIVALISEISSLQPVDPTPHPLVTLQSITRSSTCNHCQTLHQISTTLNTRTTTLSTAFNSLLTQTHQLIDLYYQLFQEQQLKFDETVIELQKDTEESQEKCRELEAVLRENGTTIMQFRNLLLEKDEQILRLEERLEKIRNERVTGSPNNEIQVLRHHRREKSHLANRLQSHNNSLMIENGRLKQQNAQLSQKIKQLQEYVSRMEDDLAGINVRSPKILNKFTQLAPPGSYRVDRSSIQQQSPINIEQAPVCDDSNEHIEEQSEAGWQQQSSSSSFAPNGQPLRDMLNITSQTSNYFNFRTKERFQESNAQLIKNYSSNENNENDPNCTNVRHEDKENMVKIMEIKEFQVQDSLPIIDKNLTKPQKLEIQMIQSPPTLQIDPYYAFFTLTVQCLKLNWKNLDQVSNISMADQWDSLLAGHVPINKWSQYLGNVLGYRVLASK